MTAFRQHEDVAVIQCGVFGNPVASATVRYATVTEAGPCSVTIADGDSGTKLFLLDSRDRAWADSGRLRLVHLCRCGRPITGTPVSDPGDPLGRQFCRQECADTEAEAAQEQHYPSGVAT